MKRIASRLRFFLKNEVMFERKSNTLRKVMPNPPRSEATVRNPLPATLWFLLHDARQGLLEQNQFVLFQHSSGETVYQRHSFFLHQNGFWLDSPNSRLVYRNTSRTFYSMPLDRDPLEAPAAGEKRVALPEGFESVKKLLDEHEQFIQEQCGRGYRASLLSKMPRSERRYAKNWKLLFGADCGALV